MTGRLLERVGLLAACLTLGACTAQPDVNLTTTMFSGDYGEARLYLTDRVDRQPKPTRGGSDSLKNIDRTYLLNRMRLAIATLADGYPHANDRAVEETYEVLRTAGINEDKTVAAVVLNEDLKTWKGEPFEQAMAFCYIGMHYAMQGDWGNMRAAAQNSLFYLRDFGGRDAEELAREAAQGGDAVLNRYRAVESNFTLGYLLNAIASQQLGERAEADESYEKVVSIDPGLKELVEQFRGGSYNTIFVVDYGQGPQKIATGPDNAVAEFRPIHSSDRSALVVDVGGGASNVAYPVVSDLNALAGDLMWNNLEDVRLAKSFIGDAMIIGGALSASSGSETAQYVGLGLLLAGAMTKANARADTLYCEVMPQRTYIVPATINGPDDRVSLMVAGRPQSQLVMTGLNLPPPGQRVQLRYVRLVSNAPAPPAWAVSGKILYGNEYAPDAAERNFPYILGGDDVRLPTAQTLLSYQKDGHLLTMSLGELQELYRAEEIVIADDPARQPGLHVLEGGDSLVAPLPGTAGYARLFGRRHPPYQPRSELVRNVAARLNSAVAGR